MEDRCSDLRMKKLLENLYELFLGEIEISLTNKKNTIIKINDENLSRYGDICFLTNLETWRKVFPDNLQSSSKNLLEYYLTRNEIEFNKDEEVMEKAFRNIIEASINWLFKIEKCSLRNERVCLFLNRKSLFKSTINRIVERDIEYGKIHHEYEKDKKLFHLDIVYDKDSELTNLRLRLLRGVAENIIAANGHEISNDIKNASKYDITTKSKIISKDISSEIILCGVAKNRKTNTKDTEITETQYCDEKLKQLSDTTDNKIMINHDDKIREDSDSGLKKIAHAAIALEFLAVRPSRPITVAIGIENTNTKGSSFVLYNTARISAILDRFDEECSRENYPNLMNIKDVDFSLLDKEEEWELGYNYLLRYPEMIESSFKLDERNLEINPQYICSFLFNFCNKFSVYYRRFRILTEGRDHLLPTMMARLYLLKAIQIVICNALRILNIDPVSRM